MRSVCKKMIRTIVVYGALELLCLLKQWYTWKKLIWSIIAWHGWYAVGNARKISPD